MAHLSAQVNTVRRSVGQNAIASAAYISRSKLSLNATDKDTNITVQLAWDYSKKDGFQTPNNCSVSKQLRFQTLSVKSTF